MRRLTTSSIGAPGRDRRIFSEVLTGHVAYGANAVGAMPDLVAVPEDGIFVRATLPSPAQCSRGPFTGTHTRTNAFLLSRRPRALPDPIPMHDVLDTILAANRHEQRAKGE